MNQTTNLRLNYITDADDMAVRDFFMSLAGSGTNSNMQILDREIQALKNAQPNQMIGATSSKGGEAGIAPAPSAGKETSFLRGDATWADPMEGYDPDGTVKQAGGIPSYVQANAPMVTVVDSVNSTSTTNAASANSVRRAYEAAVPQNEDASGDGYLVVVKNGVNYRCDKTLNELLAKLKPTLSNGPYLISESCTFDLAETFGLRVGDIVNVICVGGGGGSGFAQTESRGYAGGYGGGAHGRKGIDTDKYSAAAGGSGFVTQGSFILNETVVDVIIGEGGVIPMSSTEDETDGSPTSFGTYLTAAGGGAGVGRANSSITGKYGGSGRIDGEAYVARTSTQDYAYGGTGVVVSSPFGIKTADESDDINVNGRGAVFIWW